MPGALWFAFGDSYIHDNSFHAASGEPLYFYENNNSLVSQNVFTGTGNSYATRAAFGSVEFRHNEFNNCLGTMFRSDYANCNLAINAANQFLAPDPDFGVFLLDPFIEIHYGSFDLDCGYNRFQNPVVSAVTPFVSFPDNTEEREWRKNYWEYGESSSVPCDNVNAFLPPLIDASNCLVDYVPNQFYWCPPAGAEDLNLWEAGKNAEANNQKSEAIFYYSELVRLYPKSKYAPLAAERLKLIGKSSSSYASAAQTGLDEGASAATLADIEWLASVEETAALCIEAMHGDQSIAIDGLEAMITDSATVTQIDCASMSLLEIATYPQQGGGLSTVGNSQQDNSYIQSEIQDAAIAALFAYKMGEPAEIDSDSELPTGFSLRRIYPNPFNPRTNIEFILPDNTEVDVVIFNLLGEKVNSVFKGTLEAGIHTVVFDGSQFASGVYVVQVQSKFGSDFEKIVLLK